MYTLETKQIVKTSMEKAWLFISRPENLNRITPQELDFEILSNIPDEMYSGLIIKYRIRIPIIGRQSWVTEIKHIRPGLSFVDEQRLGPYKFWYHYHEIREVDGGVELYDNVSYDVPFLALGKLIHSIFIRKMLVKIFDHRKKMFTELLAE